MDRTSKLEKEKKVQLWIENNFNSDNLDKWNFYRSMYSYCATFELSATTSVNLRLLSDNAYYTDVSISYTQSIPMDGDGYQIWNSEKMKAAWNIVVNKVTERKLDEILNEIDLKG